MRKLDREPTAADLRRIDAEWPQIAAGLAIVDAEISAARAEDDQLSARRRRRHLSAPGTHTGHDLGGAA